MLQYLRLLLICLPASYQPFFRYPAFTLYTQQKRHS